MRVCVEKNARAVFQKSAGCTQDNKKNDPKLFSMSFVLFFVEGPVLFDGFAGVSEKLLGIKEVCTFLSIFNFQRKKKGSEKKADSL